MTTFISKPILVEAFTAQDLLSLVSNHQELPELVQQHFIDGTISFGNGVVYVGDVEASGNNWIVIDPEREVDDDIKVLEDAAFRRLFEDGESSERPKDPGPDTRGPKPGETPPASPTVPAPTPTPAAPQQTGPEGGRTNYQAPQQNGGQQPRPQSPAQNLDGLKN